RLRASAEHGVANGLGAARPHGGRGGRRSRGQARDRLFGPHAGRRRLLERAALHGHGLPARVLSALSRLLQILPAVGARALPQPPECHDALGALRDVTRLCGARVKSTNRNDEFKYACTGTPRRRSSFALNFGLWLQARSATTHIVNNNEKQRRPSPNHETFSSRRRRCALGPIDFRRVSNTLASSCNLGVVRRAAACSSRRRRAQEK